MTRRCWSVLAAIALGLHSTRAQAAPEAFEAFYAKLTESTIRTRLAQRRTIESARKRWRAYEVSLHEPTLTTANATTASELAQAAISTSVQGADAGITMSPLALFGMQASAFQLSTTLAALKGGATRVVAAGSYQFPDEQLLDLDACKPIDDNEVRIEALKIHDGYKQTCEQIATVGSLPMLPDAEKQKHAARMVTAARYACGLDGPTPKTLETGQTELLHAVDELTTLYAPDAVAQNDALQPKLAALQTARTALAATKASFTECHTQDELGDAAVRTAWEARIVRVGVSVREDRAQRVFGFNPDAPKTPLSDGRLNDGELRAEITYIHERVQATIGVGSGEARIALTDPLVRYVSPALSVAVVVGSLTSDPLYKGSHVNVVNGALPPRLVVGVDALFHYASSPPDTYANFEKVAITAYGDFRFTDKLAFRLGVPVTAEMVTRKADDSKMPPVPAKHDLQWAIPVFVATVIKL